MPASKCTRVREIPKVQRKYCRIIRYHKYQKNVWNAWNSRDVWDIKNGWNHNQDDSLMIMSSSIRPPLPQEKENHEISDKNFCSKTTTFTHLYSYDFFATVTTTPLLLWLSLRFLTVTLHGSLELDVNGNFRRGGQKEGLLLFTFLFALTITLKLMTLIFFLLLISC